jgi:hypothetical protein
MVASNTKVTDNLKSQSVYNDDAFEEKKRSCRTCGIIARCLKKEHRKDAAPGIIQ